MDGQLDGHFKQLLADARACTLCKDLPLGPKPVMRCSAHSKIIIIGQAPGTRAHESDLTWNDPSGDRLRDWLGVDRETFYDTNKFGCLPMGFCYPGTYEKGGDLPPRPQCAPAWHGKFMEAFQDVRLTLLVGSYALNAYPEGVKKKKTMTAMVKNWRAYEEHDALPLPHPSWRNTAWMRRNPWYEAELLPRLRQRVSEIVGP